MQRTLWEEFLHDHPNVEFVWVQYLAYNATPLVQVLPVARFTELVQTGQPIPFVKAGIHLEPFDRMPAGVTPGGVCYLQPNMTTAYCKGGPNSHRAVVMASCLDMDGNPLDECPKARLVTLSDTIAAETGCDVSVGFEIEVVYLRRVKENKRTIGYESLDEPHSVFSMTADDQNHLEMLETTVRALLAAGIAIEKFHAEAAPGQWEFALPPDSPLNAADMLLRATSIISDVAESYDLRATMCPRPLGRDPCSGRHVHLSLNPRDGGRENNPAEAFFAGIIHHLPAVMALTLARDMSYSRVANGICSGGEYACWGWQNKEVALRRIALNRFEMKLLDGLANPYLALCGLLAAGLDGLRRKLPLTAGSCPFATDKLSSAEREALGITTLLPKSLPASLDALEADGELCALIGDSIVNPYVSMKRAEVEVFGGMDEKEKRDYLIGRY
ncbi:hypothetical protein FE257_011229 [Aspergillus nanangensis]|uniref:GS catalytic domain-containing protein n=1 Tax=Aspergillus nanangensis TaxID=2582783 RepID=A0AAD4CHR6_ASPNN|nr:hypothetical protein FE257_011229 [Aspergillus nanangensis]